MKKLEEPVQPRPAHYVGGLDGLRAIAVIFVIFAHWGLPPGLDHPLWRKLLPGGGFAVDLFFVISGFLITGILLRSREAIRQRRISLQRALYHFYARRALRIFPVYYLLLGLLLVMNHKGVRDSWGYYATYTENFHVFFSQKWNGFSHTWSLAVEEQFYLIWPLLVICMGHGGLKWLLGTFLIAGSLFSLLQTRLTGNSFWVLLPSCLDAFAMGGVIALVRASGGGAGLMRLLCLALIPALILYFYWAMAPEGGRLQSLERLNNSLISGVLVLGCALGRAPRFLHWALLRKIGVISYGLYLYHYVMPHYWWSGGQWWRYYAMWGALLGIALLSYHGLEAPLLRLKNRFDAPVRPERPVL